MENLVLFFGFSLDVPENTFDLKEFYMKLLKEEFESEQIPVRIGLRWIRRGIVYLFVLI